MNFSFEDIQIIVIICRALSTNPKMQDDEFDLVMEWSTNSYKTPDVIVDFEKKHIVVDPSEGKRISYSTSLFHELAGIAFLNNFQFFEDPWYTENSTNNDD